MWPLTGVNGSVNKKTRASLQPSYATSTCTKICDKTRYVLPAVCTLRKNYLRAFHSVCPLNSATIINLLRMRACSYLELENQLVNVQGRAPSKYSLPRVHGSIHVEKSPVEMCDGQ